MVAEKQKQSKLINMSQVSQPASQQQQQQGESDKTWAESDRQRGGGE